ncbi:hypothetical protein GOBAR_AA29434 [Gossypium barbadense]|uniref:Zinc knuckle CX2CX4HX4C domain-containing protein n=1 Tax=Gossypium barbadense TaxID=3634 RepID=A0A2P5WJJ7_GOSBA|nr:hypothetical protein GOBAR_AA29434 [Gossypium barbadense]
MEERPDSDTTILTDEINVLLGKLKFSEEESVQIMSTNDGKNVKGFESWAVGKVMATEHPNREAMYRVFKSLWYTKEEVDFVALKEGAVIVKFGCLEDRCRILNLMPWLFDKCLFSMVPFVKGKNIASYEFGLSPFWLRVYNIPIELMDRQLAVEVGNAIGELVAIDWKDRNGAWTEFMRLKVKINISKPLRRIVKLASRYGGETIGVIKYERLPDFCYVCGLIGHTSKNYKDNREGDGINDSNAQYGSWMRAPFMNPNQERNMRRNGVEIVKTTITVNEDKEESQTNSRDESRQSAQKGKEKEVDLKTDNGWFTWVNNREGTARVKERLDRFLMSANAVNSFPFLETRVIRQSSSDHDAISLDTEGRRPRDGLRDPRLSFKYDVCWARNEKAKKIIKEAWQRGSQDTLEKISFVGNELGRWQYKKLKQMRNQIGSLQAKINSTIDG